MDQGTEARNIVYLTECLPIIHKALGSIPHKLDMVVHTCNPSTWEAQSRGAHVQGHVEAT